MSTSELTKISEDALKISQKQKGEDPLSVIRSQLGGVIDDATKLYDGEHDTYTEMRIRIDKKHDFDGNKCGCDGKKQDVDEKNTKFTKQNAIFTKKTRC